MTLPAELLDLPNTARSILRKALEAAKARALQPEAAAVGGYVRLQPYPDHAVAVYVHPTKFSIALDKDIAGHVCRTYPTFEFEDKTATGYVHVPYTETDTTRAVVIGLITDALHRSAAAGPKTFPGPHTNKGQEPAPELCPTHHLAMANGRCDYCG